MEHEFSNRIAAQRAILDAINANAWPIEPLLGLSSKAIDRWVSVNRLAPDSPLVKLTQAISAKLFFLANKSQEQVSSEYSSIRADIMACFDQIKTQLKDNVPPPLLR